MPVSAESRRSVQLRPNSKIYQRAVDLAEYLRRYPEGVTYADVEHELGWSIQDFRQTVSYLRHVLRDSDANLISEPNGYAEPWTYRITGDWDDGRAWLRMRQSDVYSRTRSMLAVLQSFVNHYPDTTAEGRAARRFQARLEFSMDEFDQVFTPATAETTA